MAKIIDPVQFSEHFGIDSKQLDKICVLDPTLNVDTGLFIDPLLLGHSQHREIKHDAYQSYAEHFKTIIKLLRASQSPEDVAWRRAYKLLSFPEIKWTCLGYGAASVSGSGSGSKTTNRIIQTAKEIIDLGVDDPDLFVAMGLFEEGFGPDHISDMTTNVIFEALLKFNHRILDNLPVPREELTITLRNGREYHACLPTNPHIKRGPKPVVLVPTDILRDLPIATDWSGVAVAASQNAAIRNRVNTQISEMWEKEADRDKRRLRHQALAHREAFETLLMALKQVDPVPYDMSGDPGGQIFWRKLISTLAKDEPLELELPIQLDVDGVAAVVEKIIQQFQFLIEERRFSRVLYSKGKPHHERVAQHFFFAVAYAYCKANGLDITPEAETGNGPVDFKISSGFDSRVLVEIKLSKNTRLVRGYENQITKYTKAEETAKGYYVVIDVGNMGEKYDKILKRKNEATRAGKKVPELVYIDGEEQLPASKL